MTHESYLSVPVMIGGTGYTAVGTAAYQHLAAVATPGTVCGELSGCFDHAMACSLVKRPLPMDHGAVTLTDQPGSGVKLNLETLAQFQEDHVAWSV